MISSVRISPACVTVLVIPDVHLKPWMFDRASDLMKEKKADRAVCLMDIADDWNQSLNIDLYNRTYERAIRFAAEYPDTLWCYGNHDLCYPWNRRESGYSTYAPWTVCEKLKILKASLRDESQLAYIHKIDNVLFSHAGLADEYVRQYLPAEYYDDIDGIIAAINSFGSDNLWQDISPIWFRPQHSVLKMYKPGEFLQVVGHTPVESVERKGNLISCDVFSTDDAGRPIGSQEFPVIDTIHWDYGVYR